MFRSPNEWGQGSKVDQIFILNGYWKFSTTDSAHQDVDLIWSDLTSVWGKLVVVCVECSERKRMGPKCLCLAPCQQELYHTPENAWGQNSSVALQTPTPLSATACCSQLSVIHADVSVPLPWICILIWSWMEVMERYGNDWKIRTNKARWSDDWLTY